MQRLKFLSTLAIASTALVFGAATVSEAKEEPIACTITETDDLFIISGTMKDATFDCKGKILYLKGFVDITYCTFVDVTHYVGEVHPDSRFQNNTVHFMDTDTESMDQYAS